MIVNYYELDDKDFLKKWDTVIIDEAQQLSIEEIGRIKSISKKYLYIFRDYFQIIPRLGMIDAKKIKVNVDTNGCIQYICGENLKKEYDKYIVEQRNKRYKLVSESGTLNIISTEMENNFIACDEIINILNKISTSDKYESLHMFFQIYQDLFSQKCRAAKELVLPWGQVTRCPLIKNLRNTQPIANAAYFLVPMKNHNYINDIVGPKPRMIFLRDCSNLKSSIEEYIKIQKENCKDYTFAYISCKQEVDDLRGLEFSHIIIDGTLDEFDIESNLWGDYIGEIDISKLLSDNAGYAMSARDFGRQVLYSIITRATYTALLIVRYNEKTYDFNTKEFKNYFDISVHGDFKDFLEYMKANRLFDKFSLER